MLIRHLRHICTAHNVLLPQPWRYICPSVAGRVVSKSLCLENSLCPRGEINVWQLGVTHSAPTLWTYRAIKKSALLKAKQANELFRKFSWAELLCLYSKAPWEVEDKKPPPEWPLEGNVEFHDYSVRYREGLDLVLKKLTLSVKGGERVGNLW